MEKANCLKNDKAGLSGWGGLAGQSGLAGWGCLRGQGGWGGQS